MASTCLHYVKQIYFTQTKLSYILKNKILVHMDVAIEIRLVIENSKQNLTTDITFNF